MAKLRLNGEVFDWDGGRKPKMSEALAIEEAYGRGYMQWQQDLAGGVLRAMCTLAWFIWRQNGRDVPIDDVMSDDFDFDFTDFVDSVVEAAAAQAEAEAEAGKSAVTEGAQDPTAPGASPGPPGSPTTSSDTSASSPSTSGSGRGKSASSKSRSSKP